MRRLRRLTADSTAKRFLSAAHTATSPVTSGGAFSVCSALCTVWLRVLLGMIALRRYYNAFGTFCQYFFYRGAFFGKAQHPVHVWWARRRFSDCVSAYPFFFLRRKKKGRKKELQGVCPLDPRLRWRYHNRMGSGGEGSVQVAQRGQVGVRTVKHHAAN